MDIDSANDAFMRSKPCPTEEHFIPGLAVLSNDPAVKYTSGSDLGGSDNHNKSVENNTTESSQKRLHTAEHIPLAPQSSRTLEQGMNGSPPSDDLSSKEDPARWLISWWPEPDMSMMHDWDANDRKVNKPQRPTNTRRTSVLERLGRGFGNLVHRHHDHPVKSKESTGHPDVTTPEVLSIVPEDVAVSAPQTDWLFHVVLTGSHFHKDTDAAVQAVRICGTYTSLRTATAFAHRCLFDAGYEAEWFTKFESRRSTADDSEHEDEAIVRATGPDGEIFTVTIAKDVNAFKLLPSLIGRIQIPLYHVVETIVHYLEDQSGQTRETRVMASFPSHDEARRYALTSVLCSEDRFQKDSFAEYDEAQPGEADCGYGENVVVHAVGEDGKNFLVSVLKGQEMEAVRVMEAAMEMR